MLVDQVLRYSKSYKDEIFLLKKLNKHIDSFSTSSSL